MKNKFITLFLQYVLKDLFPSGSLDARFEPTLTKKSLNISAMQFLFVIAFAFTINKFGVFLSFDFNVTIDLMPSQVFKHFLNAFENKTDNIPFSFFFLL